MRLSRLASSTRSARRILSLACCLGPVLSGCQAGREAPPTPTPESGVKLELTVGPPRGEAPLAVHLTAELVGEPSNPAELSCPSLAWVLGNGDVIITRDESCVPGQLARSFMLDYTYPNAGSYSANVRLLALDVAASNGVSILVRGPTPTPAAVAAIPGPTIIIATAGARAGARSTPVPAASANATAPATRIALARATAVTADLSRPSTPEAPMPIAGVPTAEATRATGIVGSPAAVPGVTRRPAELAAGSTRSSEEVAAALTRSPGEVVGASTQVRLATPTEVQDTATAVAPINERPLPTPPRATATLLISKGPNGASTRQAAAPGTVRPPASGPAGSPASPSSLPPSSSLSGAATRTALAEPTPDRRPTQRGNPLVPPATAELGLEPPTRMATPSVNVGAGAATSAPPSESGVVPPEASLDTAPLRVLPAELYYLSGSPPRLWQLPTSGGAPRAVTGAGEAVTDYAISPAGVVAYTSSGALRLILPDTQPQTLAEHGASAPIWSRDGRHLAYSLSTGAPSRRAAYVYDLASGRESRRLADGAPVAWSREATWLLVRRGDGQPAVIFAGTGAETVLPVGSLADVPGAGGWLPDRDVLWLAGDGLRLVSFEGTVQLIRILPAAAAVSGVFIRPDLRLLAMVDGGQGPLPYLVDLTAPTLMPVPIGVGLETSPDASPGAASDATGNAAPGAALGAEHFAWSPDGRNAALATGEGLALVDPTTGARVGLVGRPASRPMWVLGLR